jgi:hypothetical protein
MSAGPDARRAAAVTTSTSPPRPGAGATRCRECSALSGPGDVFCMHCGMRLDRSPRATAGSTGRGLTTVGSLWLGAERRRIGVIVRILLAINLIGLVWMVVALSSGAQTHGGRNGLWLGLALTIVFIGLLLGMVRAPIPCAIAYLAITTILHLFAILGSLSGGVPANGMVFAVIGQILLMGLLIGLMWRVIEHGLRIRRLDA